MGTTDVAGRWTAMTLRAGATTTSARLAWLVNTKRAMAASGGASAARRAVFRRDRRLAGAVLAFGAAVGAVLGWISFEGDANL